MNQDKDFLGREPIGRLLLKLAFPTVAAQVINMLYNIVDRIYIGHISDIGAMALTVIPARADSLARHFVNPITAALEAP